MSRADASVAEGGLAPPTLISARPGAPSVRVARTVEALVLNAVLVAALFWLNVAQADRVAFAAGKGLSFVFSRSLLTYTTTLSGGGATLVSPLTLDWTQVIVVALVVLDAFYLAGSFKTKKAEG